MDNAPRDRESAVDAEVGIEAPLVQPKPNMQALRDICAGNIRRTPDGLVRPEFSAQPDSPEIPLCGKTWWEDGEQYECLMDKGAHSKHGLRGMVRNITP